MSGSLFRRLSAAADLADWRQLAVQVAHCPLCARRRPILRLDNNEIAVRCVACGASTIAMSLVSVLSQVAPDLASKHVYELSSRGALFKYLSAHAGALTCSEYLDDTALGGFRNGVQCQDVQRLTFSDDSFDACTSTEVFEHVPDDLRGFAEIHRVLKPGGVFVFTVPMRDKDETVERARLGEADAVEHLLAPEYHSDPLRGGSRVLAFRNYGRDIVLRMRGQGFECAQIILPPDPIPWGFGRAVIVGWKGRPR